MWEPQTVIEIILECSYIAMNRIRILYYFNDFLWNKRIIFNSYDIYMICPVCIKFIWFFKIAVNRLMRWLNELFFRKKIDKNLFQERISKKRLLSPIAKFKLKYVEHLLFGISYDYFLGKRVIGLCWPSIGYSGYYSLTWKAYFSKFIVCMKYVLQRISVDFSFVC